MGFLSVSPFSSLCGTRWRGICSGLLATACGLALALLAAGCGDSPRPLPGAAAPRPHVLLITVDTLRADRVGAYGCDHARTPVIDRLAASGTLCAAAETVLPRTTPAFASLFTGAEPRHHGVQEIGEYLSLQMFTLAERFQASGYRTAGISSNLLAGRFQGLHQGFDWFVGASDLQRTYQAAAASAPPAAAPTAPALTPTPRATDAAAVTRAGLDWLATQDPAAAPCFLWIHYTDPHYPYEPPAAWADSADLAAAGAFYARSAHFKPKTATLYFNLNGESAAMQPVLSRLYDDEVAFTDSEIGRFVDAWSTHFAGDSTLIVFTADHGESLGEHGYYYEHGDFVYEATTHIPLIWHWPGHFPAGARIERPVSIADIAPTLADLLRLPSTPPADAVGEGAPAARFDGRSLASILQVETAAAAPRPDTTALVFAESGSALRPQNPLRTFCGRRHAGSVTEPPFRSVRDGRWLLIQPAGARPPRLYDLGADPALQQDLRATRPQLTARLSAALAGRGLFDGRWKMVRDGRWKLIRTPDLSGFTDHLYDLRVDPAETHDLIAADPAAARPVAARLGRALDRWLAAAPAAPLDHSSTTPPPPRDPDAEARLRSLGYID